MPAHGLVEQDHASKHLHDHHDARVGVIAAHGAMPLAAYRDNGAVEMAESVRAYLVWRTIVNCGLGLFLGIVYHLIGLRQPWTWALITALFCYVPYLGTILAGIPPVLDAFIYCSAWHALFIIILYTSVVTFEGYIIVPVVMGRSMDLNATTVMISCLYWDLIWGMVGLFLAGAGDT